MTISTRCCGTPATNGVVVTDYGHADNAAEIEALRKLRTDGKISGGVNREDLAGQSVGVLGVMKCRIGIPSERRKDAEENEFGTRNPRNPKQIQMIEIRKILNGPD